MIISPYADRYEIPERLTYGQRVDYALTLRQRSKTWLAKQITVSKQAMNYLVNHATKPKYVSEIALALDINPEWLETGQGPVTLPLSTDGIRYIPILRLEDVIKRENLSTENEKCIIADNSISTKSFAVILDNTSMEPLFKKGSILIFDPTRAVKDSDFVIFLLHSSNEVLIRQYFMDGKAIHLRALDNMYRNIKEEDITIYGVLAESRNTF